MSKAAAGGGIDGATRQAIEVAIVEWCWLIDHGRAGEAATLFTEDAEQSIAGVAARGIEAIAAGLARRQAMTARTSRHLMSNLRLSRLSESEIAASWILTLYRSDDDSRPARPVLVADVVDCFRRTGSGWKFRTHTVVPAFTS